MSPPVQLRRSRSTYNTYQVLTPGGYSIIASEVVLSPSSAANLWADLRRT